MGDMFMKKISKIHILGAVAAVLAIAVLAVGLYTNVAKRGNGSFATMLKDARNKQAAMDNAEKAGRNAASVEMQAETASGRIDSAISGTAAAIDAADALDTALVEGAETGDVDVDMLISAMTLINGGLDEAETVEDGSDFAGALADISAGAEIIDVYTDEKILALYQACVDEAICTPR